MAIQMNMRVNKANKVYLDDRGVIQIHVVGDQFEASVREMGEAAMRLAKRCERDRVPVLMIDNLMQIGEVPATGRKVVVEYGKKIEYNRLALLGKGHLLRLGANLLIQAIGKGDSVRYFEDEQQAMRWLLNDY